MSEERAKEHIGSAIDLISSYRADIEEYGLHGGKGWKLENAHYAIVFGAAELGPTYAPPLDDLASALHGIMLASTESAYRPGARGKTSGKKALTLEYLDDAEAYCWSAYGEKCWHDR